VRAARPDEREASTLEAADEVPTLHRGARTKIVSQTAPGGVMASRTPNWCGASSSMSSTASRRFARASSNVRPWERTPSASRTSAAYQPSEVGVYAAVRRRTLGFDRLLFVRA